MIVIPRGLARSFRAVARACAVARTRAPAPPVVVTAERGRLTLRTTRDDVVLSVEAAHTDAAARSLVVPWSVFDPVGGAAVALSVEGRAGTARWPGRDGTNAVPFEALTPGPPHDRSVPPGTWHPVPPAFLAAWHACAGTAAREPGRFALHRIQVDGRAGSVVATDGRWALIGSGFPLPFPDSVLLPATPVFGHKELAGPTEVRVGRTEDGFGIRTGPWTVRLAVDKTGRFPDVARVVSRSRGSAAGRIEERDAADLLAALPTLPGAGEEDRAVTLDFDGGVTVRARDDATGKVRDVRLSRSSSTGPPVRIALDRRALARALALGCRSLRLAPGAPMLAEGPDRTFVAMTLDAARVVPPEKSPLNLIPEPVPEPERSPIPMNTPETSDHDFLRPRPEPAARGADPLDLLAEAEGLRTALAEAARRAGRLVQALRPWCHPRRVVDRPEFRRKSLGTGPGGGA